jgi:TRAP-type transport system periplasmic protein
MGISRRAFVATLAAPAVFGISAKARAAARVFKISHQFPASNGETGDFRDRMCRRFAAAVESKTNGEIKFEFYPSSSLVKTFSQFDALKRGALDFALVPTTYAGGLIPEMNLTFMPAIVTSYEQAYRWKSKPIGEELESLLSANGVKLIAWLWESGGIASRDRQILAPSTLEGLKIRGGSREMDMMFKAGGAATQNMPSNEIYISLQTGSIGACATSSTSLVSFRIDELSKYLLAPGTRSFFFVFEPILISKQIFDGLPKEHRDAIVAAGEEQEEFGRKCSAEDDKILSEVYRKSGATVSMLDDTNLAPWQDLARSSSWKDFAARSANCDRLLKLAEQA